MDAVGTHWIITTTMRFPAVATTVHSDHALRPMVRFQTCRYPAGLSSPDHTIPLRQTILVLEGRGLFHQAGHPAIVCLPGVLLVLPDAVPYRWRFDRETALFQCHHHPFNPLEHRALAGLFGSMMDRLAGIRLPGGLFTELSRRISADIALPPVARGLALSADLLRAMAAAVEAGDGPGDDAAGSHPGLARALAHLEANVHREVGLGELALQAGLGPSRLAELFRLHTGHSPGRHHAHLRAERATTLLLAEGLGATEIAERLGFASESCFRRFYRRVTGRTPGAVRRRR
jgi:AraC-like DNA-binding protein